MMAEAHAHEVRGEHKMVLREKFSQLYDQFFKGEDPSAGKESFWQDLFLLKVNADFLDKLIAGKGEEQLLAQKETVNMLFVQYSRFLKDENDIRVANVLQTMIVLLSAIFKKKFTQFGFDAINLIMGFDQAEPYMQEFLRTIQTLLKPQAPAVLRGLALNLLSVIVTATDNINENTLLEYFMVHSIFDSLAQVLRGKDLREAHGAEALFLLAVLINFRKHEGPNPYLTGLTELNDDVVLHGVGSIVVARLMAQNAVWIDRNPPSAGMLGRIGALFSSMFVASEETSSPITVGPLGALLLALYETVHLSANFVTMLTHTQVVSRSPEGTVAAATPASLLSEYITYTSFLFQCTDPDGLLYTRLAFVTLMRVAEDVYANMYMHDPNVTIPVLLHRVALRHRPASTERLPPAPLACAVLSLIVEYLVAHLKRSIQLQHLSLAISVVQRLVAYQKRQQIRLPFLWQSLWAALIGLLRFVVPKDGPGDRDVGAVVGLVQQVLTLLNIFVTYGDAFLPDAGSYDALYYELLRARDAFDLVNEFAVSPAVEKALGQRLVSGLINLRAITSHFAPKIDAWSADHNGATITPDEVLRIVRDNYDTLTLKLQENLDTYEPYTEVSEAPLLRQITRAVVLAHRPARIVVEQLSVLKP
eukprot:m.246628 g.246628  ORF g.246628 m.246628 type:complete len:646 (-) comp15117_c0_seq1:116-2053(-)